MAIKILINGLLQYDSGKTWFIIGLSKALSRIGYKLGVYKPLSGHNGWIQFHTILESIKRKILICEDVLKYIHYIDREIDIKLTNPIDFLLVPIDIKRYKDDPFKYINLLDNQYLQTVLIRISDYRENFSNYYRVDENFERSVESLKPWIRKLYEIFDPVNVDIKQLINILTLRYVDEILKYNLKKLDERNDIVLIESYNNASVPYKDIIKDIDLMISVTYGYIIKPYFKKAREFLINKLDEYLTTDHLIKDSGVEDMLRINVDSDPIKLSNHILEEIKEFNRILGLKK